MGTVSESLSAKLSARSLPRIPLCAGVLSMDREVLEDCNAWCQRQ